MGKHRTKRKGMITATIVYDHRGRSRRDGVGTIEFRVTYNRKSYYISTGVTVARKEFVCGSVVNRADCMELNERIAILYRRLQDEINVCMASGNEPDITAIRKRLWITCDEQCGELEVVDWIEDQEQLMNLREGTLKHYRTLRRRLKEFGWIKRWTDIDVECLCMFDSWLHRLRSDGGHNLSDTAIYSYHKCLKAIINRAVLFGKMQANPYSSLRGRFRRGERDSVEYLTDDEMQRIEAVRPYPGSPLAKARDLFVFQMHTGLSYADTQAFDFSQYSRVGDRYVCVGKRIKTGVSYISCLSDECERILKRYGWSLPTISNAEYNAQLKTLALVAGVRRRLHSHVARHSFATRMLASGAKIENVSKMLGHSSVVNTQIYAKVLPESVFSDFERLEKITKRGKE